MLFQLLSVSAGALLAASAAWGAAQSPGRCAALKAKAAGTRIAATLGCHATATRQAKGTSSTCLGRAQKNFDHLFAKADAKGPCGVPGDAATIGDGLAAFAADVAGEFFPGGTPDGARRCAAKKMQQTGAYGRGRLACWARAFRDGIAVDGQCLTGAAAKLVVGFTAAEKKPGCATAGDVSSVEDALDGFLDGLASQLVSSPTTTTTLAGTSLSADVQPIFTANCALPGCHAGPSPQMGLNLSAGQALANLVNVASGGCTQFNRVAPGQPGASYILFKLAGPPQLCFSGERMPKGKPALPAADQDTIRAWITQGAPNN